MQGGAHSSKTTAATPSRLGSDWRRRTRTPVVTTSTRVDDEALDSCRTRNPTLPPRGSLIKLAILLAAPRAATRRGSRTII